MPSVSPRVLDEVFPPRSISADLMKKIGYVAPWRKVVLLDGYGGYQVVDVPDETELSDFLEPCGKLLLVASNKLYAKQYPSEASTRYALALAGMGFVEGSVQIVCVDGRNVEWGSLPADNFADVELLYQDSDDRNCPLAPVFAEELFRTTYRGHVIWNGDVPDGYASKCIEMEALRRYRFMLSKSNQSLRAPLSRENRSWYLGPDPHDSDLSAAGLSRAVRRLGCGVIDFDFEKCPDVECSKGKKTDLEAYLDENVSFSKLVLDSYQYDVSEPDYGLLRGMVEIWGGEVLKEQEKDARFADLLAEDLERLADEHGLESYMDALVGGVPVEDLLA